MRSALNRVEPVLAGPVLRRALVRLAATWAGVLMRGQAVGSMFSARARTRESHSCLSS
jgi:hypothetical protein